MKIYYMGRMTGKTALMIKESNRTGYPIICPNVATATCIKSQAKRLKLEIPEPISILRIIDKRADEVKAKHVLIDEAQACLEAIISNRMSCYIDAMTVGKREDETAQESISDELLLQEVYSLREKLKIALEAVKSCDPKFDAQEFMHQLNSADYDQLAEEMQSFGNYYYRTADRMPTKEDADECGCLPVSQDGKNWYMRPLLAFDCFLAFGCPRYAFWAPVPQVESRV